MKKTVIILCLYTTQSFSQAVIERTYSIPDDPDIYFIQPPVKSFLNESIYLIKSDNRDKANSIAKTEKVDPPMVLNPFPDPFSSSINVNIPGNLICNFSLSDMTGGVVFRTQIYGESGRFNLSFLPEGVYFASVSGR
jgi:hypothetical protein